MTHEAELRRQATAAGVWLDMAQGWRCSDCGRPLREPREVNGVSVLPPCAFCLCRHDKVTSAIRESITSDEVEQLLVWLDRWQDARREWLAERRMVDAVYSDYVKDGRGGRVWHFPMLSRARHEAVSFELREYGYSISDRQRSDRKWRWVPGEGRQLPIVRPLLDPPAGFELVRHSWCPRCERDGDPLGAPREVATPVVPPAPELEIGAGCAQVAVGPGCHPCGARRLYRWGLRREQEDVSFEPDGAGWWRVRRAQVPN